MKFAKTLVSAHIMFKIFKARWTAYEASKASNNEAELQVHYHELPGFLKSLSQV